MRKRELKPHRSEDGRAVSCVDTQDIEIESTSSIDESLDAFKPFNPELSRKLDCVLSLVERENDSTWLEKLGQYRIFLEAKLVADAAL